MKLIKFFITVSIISCLISCNEDNWLTEEPYSIFTPDNSYTTPDEIDIALVDLYSQVRNLLCRSDNAVIYQMISDITYGAINTKWSNNQIGTAIIPESNDVNNHWRYNYSIIANANTILSRITQVEYSSQSRKDAAIAEAKFFRAFSYRNLVNLFGGVPIVLEEVTASKRDFVRATKEEVVTQIIADLTDAVPHLPGADDVADGRITKGAANHLLTEIYIINKEYGKAVDAATEVIDNSGYQLMTNRFGKRKNEPGDVYWDLFRIGNQNRSSGNTESIWVSQFEYNVPGGGRNDRLAYWHSPGYWAIKMDDGVNAFPGPQSRFGGRSVGQTAPTDFLLNKVWTSPTDIRNSEYNIIRDIPVTNPASAYYGQMLIASGGAANITPRFWTAIFAKTVALNEVPENLIIDPVTGVTANGADSSFRDRYMMRLAETYLLRAEAYFLMGDQDKAADDINKVRERAHADPVSPGDVDLDYILDERTRELAFEELRLLTLYRTGKFIERMKLYNDVYNGTYDTNIIFDYNNVFPIPAPEIERNTEAVLEQNPGY